ncbi:biotin--[acetyl-CoA-carboxylase] ligase [Haloferula sargassicola]|uniref:biotin--[biotin carboxyl-carrier protein] ligase n=1 Tax=Haloferula sargassicola TaxID=490096 RepID=A0ABP9UU96_9BACT
MSDWRAPEGWRIEVVDEIDSTNEEWKRRQPGHGRVLVALKQSAGRGRRGNVWLSEPGVGLTFSVALRPSEPKGMWPRLALATGLAVAEALGKLGIEAEVKWPNDVLLGGKKVCGVLVEAVGEVAVIGIGLNVNAVDLPEGLEATSLRIVAGREFEVTEVLGLILDRLKSRTGQIGADFPELVARLRERCFLSGKRVRLKSPSGPTEGVVQGIGDGGELLLQTAEGLQRLLQADEVRAVE